MKKSMKRIVTVFFTTLLLLLPQLTFSQSRLYNTVSSDNESKVKRYLRKGDNPNGDGNPRYIPLISAAEKNLYGMVRILIESKANVNIQNHIGFTPLMEATIQGNNRVMKYLLDNGAQLELRANNGATALMIAVNADNIRGAKLLLENGADPNIYDIDDESPIMKTLKRGDNPEMIDLLADYNADVNAKNKQGTPVIMSYPYRNRIPVFKALISKGADVNIRNSEGKTPLIKAVLEGNLEMVKILIEKGADPTLKDEFDTSALDYAITQFEIKQYFDSLNK
jgi:ankyrin repeat protein